MQQLLKNYFVKAQNGLDFSRNIFSYEKRHTTNLLSGAIVPVNCQFVLPGMSYNVNFGCSLESAPLISTNFDNIYVDVVTIWTPIRLVMTDFNEFLGESHNVAFTINRSITIPKTTKVNNLYWDQISQGASVRTMMSRAFLADNFLSVHFGCRYHGELDCTDRTQVPAESQFAKGISVLPSRVYELNWNTYFRNENVQAPILIDKTHVFGSHDATYVNGLGRIQFANKLKNFYTVATPSPSLMDVPIALEEYMAPVGFTSTSAISSGTAANLRVNDVPVSSGDFAQLDVGTDTAQSLYADLSLLTVNRMYYALMLQKFANKMMKGRRAVEFYENFFGIKNSEAGHDLPQIIIQKRYPLNITQIVATAAGTDGTNTTDLGQKGAYSVTGFGGPLIKNFTSTEHGYLQTYLIIRGQPSLCAGIDKHLGYDGLLDTYLMPFDHIGPVGIETLELAEPVFGAGSQAALNFGFTNAWYQDRKQVSDVVGICEPGQPLAYKTLALGFFQSNGVVISDAFLRHTPDIIDRIFMYPVCDSSLIGAIGYNEYGENAQTTRYQFIAQFVVKGEFAAVMSRDSDPLEFKWF